MAKTAKKKAASDAPQAHQFQAEVAKLLHLMVHSVYSDRDVFLRERTFLPDRTMPFVMPSAHSANLDTQEDWQILQAMVAQGYWTPETYD